MNGPRSDQGLAARGWDPQFAAALAELKPSGEAFPARVISQDRDRWAVRFDSGVKAARIAGSALAGGYPAILPRRSAISRGAAGAGSAAQVLAANMDVVWIVHGLDLPLNPRRLERYLAAAWQSGATPEVVLTKADLAAQPHDAPVDPESIAIGVAVHVVSTEDPSSIGDLKRRLPPGRTFVLLGPSGVGKSTLINLLADRPLAPTGEVREYDRKGRHTTTRRELFQLSGGALVIDTPGLREFRIWAVDEGLGRTFPEIDDLARSCRFRDCRHESEPGCTVLAAAAAGALDPERLASYRKLKAEAAYLERKHDAEAQAAAVSKHKTALKTPKYHPKYRRES